MKTLGEKLRYLRKSNYLTQDELAEIFHVTRSQISTYETDRSEPSYPILKRYCDYFSVSADFLLNIERNEQILERTDKLMRLIQRNMERMTEQQKEQYLKQLQLYAVFLDRYKESL